MSTTGEKLAIQRDQWPKVLRDLIMAALTAAVIGAGAGLWNANNTLTRLELLTEQNGESLKVLSKRVRDVERVQDRSAFRGPPSYYDDPRDKN